MRFMLYVESTSSHPRTLVSHEMESSERTCDTTISLRPELVESTWYMYEATGDRSWLLAAREMFESLSTLKVRGVRVWCSIISLIYLLRGLTRVTLFGPRSQQNHSNTNTQLEHRYDAELPV